MPSVGENQKQETVPLQPQELQRLMAPSPLDQAPLSLLSDAPSVPPSSSMEPFTHVGWKDGGGSCPNVTFFLDIVQPFAQNKSLICKH